MVKIQQVLNLGASGVGLLRHGVVRPRAEVKKACEQVDFGATAATIQVTTAQSHHEDTLDLSYGEWIWRCACGCQLMLTPLRHGQMQAAVDV